MSEQQNTRIVQDAYAAFQRRDIPAVLQTLSDDVEWVLPGPKEIPLTGRRHGREQVTQFFAILSDTQEPHTFEPKQFVAQGEVVIALGHYRWHVKATGRTFESDFAHVFRLRDGKVVSFQEYYDTHEGALAYGL